MPWGAMPNRATAVGLFMAAKRIAFFQGRLEGAIAAQDRHLRFEKRAAKESSSIFRKGESKA